MREMSSARCGWRASICSRLRLFGVDEVDERIRPGRHDTHPLALERLGSAIDPRAEILVEIVDEALEQAVAAVAAYRLDAAREVTAARPAGTDFTHADGIEELGEEHVFEGAPARQLMVRHAMRLPVIGEDVQVVVVLGHAAANARELMNGAIDASERAARPTVAWSEAVRVHVVIQVVHVDRGHARVDVARRGQREQLAHPDRHAHLDPEPFPATGPGHERVREDAGEKPHELDRGQREALGDHPCEHDERRDRGEQAASARPLDHRKGEEVVGGAAGEAAAVSATARQDAEPPLRLFALDEGGVARARKVDVGAPTLVMEVKRGDVRLHAVHRGQLKRRRRGRHADGHRLETVRVTQQAGEERHAPVPQRLFQDAPGEPVDLDDQQAPPAGRRCRPDAQPSDEAIDEALQREHQVVERHVAFDCIIWPP